MSAIQYTLLHNMSINIWISLIIFKKGKNLGRPRDPQGELHHLLPRHKIVLELPAIASIPDDRREILILAEQDDSGRWHGDSGRLGLYADQVLCDAIISYK
jgi:hypothetical protein